MPWSGARGLAEGRGAAAALALLAAAQLLTGAAAAQRLPAVEADHYARCMEAARQNPASAFEEARRWQANGGAHPAEHCAAVALIGLGRPAEAGKQLDALAGAMTKAPAALRAEVLGQAGQAWLLAGNAGAAEASLTQALAATPDSPDLLTDRAEAFAGEKRYPEALGDLDRALALDPTRLDALIFRAAAHRETAQLEAGLRDAEAALRLAPAEPDALLERGNIRHLQGEDEGARQDWQRVVEVAPKSPAADLARGNLAALAGAAAAGSSGATKAPPAKPAPAKPPAAKR